MAEGKSCWPCCAEFLNEAAGAHLGTTAGLRACACKIEAGSATECPLCPHKPALRVQPSMFAKGQRRSSSLSLVVVRQLDRRRPLKIFDDPCLKFLPEFAVLIDNLIDGDC